LRYLYFRKALFLKHGSYYLTHDLVIISNGLIFFDLYLILKNPFKERSKRMVTYYLVIIFSLFLMVGLAIQ
jgi:hypothetical protein